MTLPKNQLRVVALVLVCLLVWVLWPVAAVIVVSGFAVVIAQPVFEKLLRAVGARRTLAAVLATTIMTLSIFVPVAAAVYVSIHESIAATHRLKELLASTGGWEGLQARLPASMRTFAPDGANVLRDVIASVGTRVAQLAPRVVSSTGWLIAQFFLTVMTVYYLFKDGPAFVRLAKRVIPLAPAHTDALFVEYREVALGLFWGGLVTAFYHGAAAALGYWLFGVEDVALLALLTGVAAFIPLVGTSLVWIPLVVTFAFADRPYMAAGMLAYGLIVLGAGDYVLRPLVSKGHMALPRGLLFLAVFGGMQLFGAKGILFGPLLGSLAIASVRLLDRADAS